MKVRFWGTRGSIASPGFRTAKYGGNTSCVQVSTDDGTLIVLDCGTGARELGAHLLQAAPRPLRVHLFLGHTHWDHIQGFPFFTPAFLPDTELNIYAAAGFKHSLEEALAGQMQYSYFPVKLTELNSHIHFTELEEGFFRLGSVLVETQYLNHPAPTLAYRISSGGATVAYVTDHEPFWKPNDAGFTHPGDQRHISFFQGADLVIHDAQYNNEEYPSRIGWGHSTVEYATDVALAAGVKRLALFHHDPTHDDATMELLEALAKSRVARSGHALDVFAAQEGLEIDVVGESTQPSVAAVSALQPRPTAGRRILVISPNLSDINAVEQALAEEDLVISSGLEWDAALTPKRGAAPDLAIVRADEPGHGTTLARSLRVSFQESRLPVLLLTANKNDESALPEADMSADITDYLATPFSPPMLRTRVHAWLARAPLELRSQPPSVQPDGGPAQAAIVPARDRHQASDDRGSAETYAKSLASIPLFRPLNPEQVARLATQVTEHVFEPGREIMHQGGPASSVVVILSGRVRVSESALDNPQVEMVLTELGPGEVVGELGILSDQDRSASVVALERTRCLVVPEAEFMHAIRSSSDLATGLLRTLAGRIHDANRLLARFAPDPLTGISNRRAFQDQYRRLAAGARRRNNAVLLLLLDVVGLRSVNDHYGYAMGDEVLRAVADAMAQTTRATDLVARYGGDEFVALLENARRDDVASILLRLNQALANITAKRSLPVSVRCNVGVALSLDPPDNAEDLLRAADLDMHTTGAELPSLPQEPVPPPPSGQVRPRRRNEA